MQDYAVGGGGARPPKAQKVPEHIRFAQEAARERIESLTTNPNSIFDSVTYAQEGLDDDQIKEAAIAFATETLSQYDSDGDGETSVEEYIKANVEIGITNSNLLNEQTGLPELTDEEKEIYQRTNELFAKNLDVNGDGKISAEEEAYILYRADGLDDDENFQADGTAIPCALDSMGKSVTGLYSKEDSLVEKYLETGNLTPAQEKKLDDLTPEIREDIVEDAESFGFDFPSAPQETEDKGLLQRIGAFFKNLFSAE